MIKNIIFDLDGTLVDSIPDIAEGMNIFLQRKGWALISEDAVKFTIGNGARVSLERLLALQKIDIPPEDFEKLYEEYINIYRGKNITKTKLWSGVKETLSLLLKQGYEMAVCTNKPNIPTINILTKLGIKDFFPVIANPETSGVTKPELKIMLDCINGLNAKPEECVMIGDSETDVLCARAVNIPVILATFGYAIKPYQDLGADMLINNFSEIPEAIQTLRNK